jgi:hypothetical protein
VPCAHENAGGQPATVVEEEALPHIGRRRDRWHGRKSRMGVPWILDSGGGWQGTDGEG